MYRMATVTPAPSRPGFVMPPMRDRESRETKIGFGLAATCREEEKVNDLAVIVLAVDKPRKVQENESELEWSPLGGAWGIGFLIVLG